MLSNISAVVIYISKDAAIGISAGLVVSAVLAFIILCLGKR